MKYYYGVIPKFDKKKGIVVKAPQLIDLIRRDVKKGKWNIYEGGDDKHPAKISYKNQKWEYGEHIFITGSEREIKFFEEKISDFIKVIPKKFKGELIKWEKKEDLKS